MDKFLMNLLEMSQVGILAALGALAGYLKEVIINPKAGKRFRWVVLCSSIIIAFVMGNIIGDFIPADYRYRDGLLIACGYSCFPILDIIEAKATATVKKLISF